MYQTIKLKTDNRNEMIDITGQIKKLVTESGVKDGICVVCSAHTTAGITINENADPTVCSDLTCFLEKLVPADTEYFEHDEGNSDSHSKVSLIGPSVSLIVDDGQPLLGTWQGIYFAEFDGPRDRKVWVKIISG
jgi:secondary thiamine-phosphate synthase enzyme